MRVTLAVGILLLSALTLESQSPTYDVIIHGGRLVDGTGAPWSLADVAIDDDRIAAIGNLATQTATTRIDATGLVVAPGFIDMLGQSEDFVLADAPPAS